MLRFQILLPVIGVAMAASAAFAQNSTQVGALECDISSGIGLILTQKQTLKCVFKPSNGGPSEIYSGHIDQFGLALGEVKSGSLVWGVLAPSSGISQGALAGTYTGVGASATVGAGLGANILVGGTGRSFSLQPLSLQGQTGLNIAGGVTTVTLVAGPANGN